MENQQTGGKRKREQDEDDIERLSQSSGTTRSATRSSAKNKSDPTHQIICSKRNQLTEGSGTRKSDWEVMTATLTDKVLTRLGKRQKTAEC
jgi:hypothetical protein